VIFRRNNKGNSPVIVNEGRSLEGIDVLGFFSAEHGVGEAARVLTSTLQAASVPVSTIEYTDTQSRREHLFSCDNASRHKVLMMAVNADHLNEASRRLGRKFFRKRYVIGQWFWELEEAPHWFGPAFNHVDELWAPTRFIETMLRKHAPSRVQVKYVPLPVVTPQVDVSISRAHFGLDGRYMFLFSFDFMSVMKRKNPLGLIEAFSKAFADGEGPMLVIKAINGDKRLVERNMLRDAVRKRSDIVLIDEYFTKVETSTLTSLADCYVSLHRSEGLGLTMSEAMTLGRPVIATGYSGNLDFLSDANSFIVPGSRVKVGHGAEGYSPEAMWMEPNVSEAAKYIRYVYENQAEAVQKGLRGQADILRAFDVASCGAIMKGRLEQIWRSQRGN
jgi:glycosyltransferase involved in cell wall biosynthesis